MLDNIALMTRSRRMRQILKDVATYTRKQKIERNKIREIKKEYEQLRGEVKRLRRGEKP